MDEKELKTSTKQRIFIALIAVLMLGSIIASYAAIILNGGNSSSSGDTNVDQAKVAEYQEAYNIWETERKQNKNRYDILIKKVYDYKSKHFAFNHERSFSRYICRYLGYSSRRNKGFE